MRMCVIGAGALGGSFGARLAASGAAEVVLVDRWREHVEAINAKGLEALGLPTPATVRLKAHLPDEAPRGFDAAFVATDTNGIAEAARLAARLLTPEGFALTVQNGIGNIETLSESLGRERVVGGSTMCSFRTVGPGRIEQTHLAATTIGELDGSRSPRVNELAAILRTAGYEVLISTDIMTVIWTKFALNCGINALAALTGLRPGEFARLEAADRLQDLLLDEIFAVVGAKRLPIDQAALRRKIKDQCWLKYNKPSMLQHVEAGRRTEIDALNGAVVREGRALGVPTPMNEALVMLLKGREHAQMRRLHEPEPDYAALEAQAEHETRPTRSAAE